MVSDETMMFQFGKNENKAEQVILAACSAMKEKGYNSVNQLVGYLLSGDPSYITSHKNARTNIRTLDRDMLLEELVRFYLENHK